MAEWRIYTSINKTIISSDNSLAPNRRQAIIVAGLLPIGSLGTNFSEILTNHSFHSRKCIWKCHPVRKDYGIISKKPSAPVYGQASSVSAMNKLQWRHNERYGVSNHKPRDCLLNRLFKAQLKENIKAPRLWLCRVFTGHRWIPCTKCQ